MKNELKQQIVNIVKIPTYQGSIAFSCIFGVFLYGVYYLLKALAFKTAPEKTTVLFFLIFGLLPNVIAFFIFRTPAFLKRACASCISVGFFFLFLGLLFFIDKQPVTYVVQFAAAGTALFAVFFVAKHLFYRTDTFDDLYLATRLQPALRPDR